jgi:hypothetical protein
MLMYLWVASLVAFAAVAHFLAHRRPASGGSGIPVEPTPIQIVVGEGGIGGTSRS